MISKCKPAGARFAGWLAVLFTLIAGCSSLQQPADAPSVSLASLSLDQQSAGAQRFRVGLLVQNPNSTSVPVEALEFSVRLGGGGLLAGRSLEPFELAPGAAQVVEVDVDSDLVSSVSRLLALMQGPTSTIAYDLDGFVHLARGIRRTLPIYHRGEVAPSLTQP